MKKNRQLKNDLFGRVVSILEDLHIQGGETGKFSPILHNRSGELEIPQFYQRLTWSHYRVLKP